MADLDISALNNWELLCLFASGEADKVADFQMALNIGQTV